MRKTFLLYFASGTILLAQNQANYALLQGKSINISYAQISENQSFCTYEQNDSAEQKDLLWDKIYNEEIQNYKPEDSVKIIPLHRFMFETRQKQHIFFKYSIETQDKKRAFKIKDFESSGQNSWLEFTPNDSKDIAFSYLFAHIKTKVFQRLFSRENDVNEPEINVLKVKVLNISSGFVNFDELTRQLKLLERQPVFLKLCDK